MLLLNDLKQLTNGQIVPDHKLWYLLLDKQVHSHNDPTYFNHHDIDGNPTNVESNYLSAMTHTWNRMCLSVRWKDPLSPELLLELHAQCRPLSKADREDKSRGLIAPERLEPTQKISGFTGSGVFFFDNINTTKASYTHVSDAARQEWIDDGLIFDVSNLAHYKNLEITPEQIRKRFLAILIPARYTSIIPQEWITSIFEPLTTFLSDPCYLGQNQRAIKTHNDSFNNFRSQPGPDNYIVSFSGLPVDCRCANNALIALATEKKRPQIDRFIHEYYHEVEVAADDNDKKLTAIARFIRKISIDHPFADYNQRLFVFIILNKLLMDNNFMPVILDSPYIFDGYLSASELVGEIKKGFENFLQAVHPNLSGSNTKLFSADARAKTKEVFFSSSSFDLSCINPSKYIKHLNYTPSKPEKTLPLKYIVRGT